MKINVKFVLFIVHDVLECLLCSSAEILCISSTLEQCVLCYAWAVNTSRFLVNQRITVYCLIHQSCNIPVKESINRPIIYTGKLRHKDQGTWQHHICGRADRRNHQPPFSLICFSWTICPFAWSNLHSLLSIWMDLSSRCYSGDFVGVGCCRYPVLL